MKREKKKEMKKIMGLIIILILIAVILSVLVALKPNFNRRCQLGTSGISIKVPYSYQKTITENENTLLSLYEVEKGIEIEAIRLKDDFWSQEEIDARMDEYMNVLATANYDAQVKNTKLEVLELEDRKLGRVEAELEKQNVTSKSITLITTKQEGNIVIELIGEKEKMEENQAEIEKIISSIKIKKNVDND